MATAHSHDPEQACIDKDGVLYGKFEEGEKYKLKRQEKRDNLGLRLAHKSLDMRDVGDEDMDIKVTNNGLGLKELVGIGVLLAGLGTGGAGIWAILNAGKAVLPQQPAQQQFQDTDTDTGYRIKLLPPE